MSQAEARSATVAFDGYYVSIIRTRHGLVDKGEKKIPIGQISSIRFKPATALNNGYIEFVFAGSNELKGRQRSGSLMMLDVQKNENAVVFTKKQMPAFQQVKAEIEAAIAAQHAPVQYAAPSAAPSVGDQLAQLWSLVQQGAMTQAEYEQAKARLLGG